MKSEDIEKYIAMFHSSLYRTALGYVRSREDAEDICEEAFLKLLMTDKIFVSDENVKAWLLRVTINLSKDMLKSHWLLKRTDIDYDIPAESREEQNLLETVKKLPPEYAAVIYLFYYEEYSVKQISEICGISETAVTTRLSRARKKLKSELEREENQ